MPHRGAPLTPTGRLRPAWCVVDDGRRMKTWKTYRDRDYAARKARVEHLHVLAEDEVVPEDKRKDRRP